MTNFLLRNLTRLWIALLIILILLYTKNHDPLSLNYDFSYIMFLVFPLSIASKIKHLTVPVSMENRLLFFKENLRLFGILFCMNALLNISFLDTKANMVNVVQAALHLAIACLLVTWFVTALRKVRNVLVSEGICNV